MDSFFSFFLLLLSDDELEEEVSLFLWKRDLRMLVGRELEGSAVVEDDDVVESVSTLISFLSASLDITL